MALTDQDMLFADVVEKLRAAARADRPVDAAQIHLINIQDIIRNAGPHWQKIKDRIRAGSMAFLRGCLAPDDIVIPCGDGFLIIYTQGESAVLAQRSAELQGLLTEYYCGQDGLSDLKVEIEHKQVDSESFADLMVTREPTLAPAPPASIAPAMFDGRQLMFMPVWLPQAQLVGSYCCAPTIGPHKFGYDPAFRDEGQLSARDFAELDLHLLDAALAALTSQADAAPRPAIGVCMHSSTIHQRASRTAYLEKLRELPASLVKYFFVKIAEIERGAPLITVSDWTGHLRPRVGQVFLEFHYADPAVGAIDETGACGAGFLLPSRYSEEGADLTAARRIIRSWGHVLAQKRVRFFVDNLGAADLIQTAAEAGAQFITSETFWRPMSRPRGVTAARAPYAASVPPVQKVR